MTDDERMRPHPEQSGANGDLKTLAELQTALAERDELVASAAARELSRFTPPEAVAALSDALGRPGLVGQEAAHSLVVIGQPTVGSLLTCLRSPSATKRWHAAKALATIASVDSTPALIAALTDEDAGVRWEAVYGLAAIGLPALEPLLQALCQEDLPAWLATGAERVLRRLAPLVPELRLERLIRMLSDNQAHVSAPVEAYRLLTRLRAERAGVPPAPS